MSTKKLSFSLNRTLISDLKDQYQDDITTDLDMPSKAKKDISEFIPEFQLKRDNALTTLSSVEKEYFVSFDLWITELTPGWKNVLHLTTGDNNRRYGSRIPFVSVNNAGRLYINSAVNGDKTYTYEHPPVLIEKTWIKVEIEQLTENEKVKTLFNYQPHFDDFFCFSSSIKLQ